MLYLKFNPSAKPIADKDVFDEVTGILVWVENHLDQNITKEYSNMIVLDAYRGFLKNFFPNLIEFVQVIINESPMPLAGKSIISFHCKFYDQPYTDIYGEIQEMLLNDDSLFNQ
jgi:hypothetical protein